MTVARTHVSMSGFLCLLGVSITKFACNTKKNMLLCYANSNNVNKILKNVISC